MNSLSRDSPAMRQISHRPGATKLFTYKTVTVPHYTEEYCSKPMQHRAKGPMLYCTSRNIPHPLKRFTIWRLPVHFKPLIDTSLEATTQLDPDKLISDHKVLSTYQGDFLGMQQGVQQAKPAPPVQQPNSVSPPASKQTLASSMQASYTIPRQSSLLKGNTTRYGCSEGIVRATHGIVPTLANTEPPLAVSYDTWYKREFTNRQMKKPKSAELKLPKIDAQSQPQLITM